MKSVSLIGDNINCDSNIEHTGSFTLQNNLINVGLVEEEDTFLQNSSYDDSYVLIKKRAFSCNYRDKALILKYDKRIKYFREKSDDILFSYIGSEFVGEVIKIGNNVSNLKIGDRVITNISYPSYSNKYIPGIPNNHASKRIDFYNQNKLLKIPNFLPDEIACNFSIAGFTSYSMIRKVIHNSNNAKVLVTAAKSNTSLAVINALKNYPVDVYAMTSNSNNIDILYNMGVKEVFIIDHINTEKYIDNENLLRLINDHGLFNIVIDPLLDIHLNKVIDIMDFDSKYITCGFYNQFFSFSKENFNSYGNYEETIKTAMIKNISIIGNCIGLKKDFDLALEHFRQNKFNILLDRIFSSGEESDFFDRTYNSKDRLGKVTYLYK